MKKSHLCIFFIFILIRLHDCELTYSQSKGLRTITEEELRYNLEFLGAMEFRGRETPSPELEIATLYLGNWSKDKGLKPILNNGSFYQNVPITVTSVFQPGTKIVLSGGQGEQIFYYGQSFGGNFSSSGSFSGEVIFAGLGISDPENGWDDLKDLDLTGKVVIILDEGRPGDRISSGTSYYNRLNLIAVDIRNRGASALLSVVSSEREDKLNSGLNIFEDIPSGRMGVVFDSQRTKFESEAMQLNTVSTGQSYYRFGQAEISHHVASQILGISEDQIDEMFNEIKQGKQVPSVEISDIRVQLDIEVEKYKSSVRNVIACVVGSDPLLKNEYIVICGHHDGLGMREGEVIAGADDNATASVALMEIAGALMVERPKRSVIISWFAGEEKIMNGSHYFINNCPVPVEKICACLNLDMLGRNDTDSLCLVGSDLLSTGLDASINRVNKKSGINFGFDYRYSSIYHPQRVYFRSDHYPFLRFGIPSVWFFGGFTQDYHTPRDRTEFINYSKFYKITKLAYLTAFDIGNMKDMLKLDINPAVTSRGKHNITEKSLFQSIGK